MDNFRYVIEWEEAVLDDDHYDLIGYGETHRKMFADECKFNSRLSELEDRMYKDVIILGIYTCELQRITSR